MIGDQENDANHKASKLLRENAITTDDQSKNPPFKENIDFINVLVMDKIRNSTCKTNRSSALTT